MAQDADVALSAITPALRPLSVVTPDIALMHVAWSPHLERVRIYLRHVPYDALLDAALEADVIVLPMTPDTAEQSSAAVAGLVAETETPILLGVLRGCEEPAADALHAGAHGFVFLPYTRAKFIKDVRHLAALQPRTGPAGVLRSGAVTLDLRRREVAVEGRPVHLAAKEFDLLRLLFERVGNVVPAAELHARFWASSADPGNDLAVYVRRLRLRCDVDPTLPSLIRTVRGIGYQLRESVAVTVSA